MHKTQKSNDTHLSYFGLILIEEITRRSQESASNQNMKYLHVIVSAEYGIPGWGVFKGGIQN